MVRLPRNIQGPYMKSRKKLKIKLELVCSPKINKRIRISINYLEFIEWLSTFSRNCRCTNSMKNMFYPDKFVVLDPCQKGLANKGANNLL